MNYVLMVYIGCIEIVLGFYLIQRVRKDKKSIDALRFRVPKCSRA